MTQFEFHSVRGDGPDLRKAKFQMRIKPLVLEVAPRQSQPGEHLAKIPPDELRQHKAVVQRGAPADQAAFERRFPNMLTRARTSNICSRFICT